MPGTLTKKRDETIPEGTFQVTFWDAGQQIRDQHDPQKDLVGLTEIAEILGVTRQRAAQVAKREDFPEAFGVTKAGSFWLRRQVITYGVNRQERVHRYLGYLDPKSSRRRSGATSKR